MADKGKKDKGKREKQKTAQLSLKEKRKLKKEKKTKSPTTRGKPVMGHEARVFSWRTAPAHKVALAGLSQVLLKSVCFMLRLLRSWLLSNLSSAA